MDSLGVLGVGSSPLWTGLLSRSHTRQCAWDAQGIPGWQHQGLSPGHTPTGGCTRAQFQWQARPAPVSPTGSLAAKRTFLAEGASEIPIKRGTNGRPLRCGRRCLRESLGLTEDTAVIEL